MSENKKETKIFYVAHYDNGSDKVFDREMKSYEILDAKVIIEYNDDKVTVIKDRFGDVRACGKLEWMEEDLKTAKRDIEDLQGDINQIKHLLDMKGISF